MPTFENIKTIFIPTSGHTGRAQDHFFDMSLTKL